MLSIKTKKDRVKRVVLKCFEVGRQKQDPFKTLHISDPVSKQFRKTWHKMILGVQKFLIDIKSKSSGAHCFQ